MRLCVRATASPPPCASPRAAASGTMDRFALQDVCKKLSKVPLNFSLFFFSTTNLSSVGLLWVPDLVALEDLEGLEGLEDLSLQQLPQVVLLV